MSENVYFDRQNDDWIFVKISQLLESDDEDCKLLAFKLLIATANMSSECAILDSFTRISFRTRLSSYLQLLSPSVIQEFEKNAVDRFLIAMVGVYQSDFISFV